MSYDNNITWSNFSESIFTRSLDDLNYVNLFIDNNITTTDLGLELDRGIRNAKFTVMTWLKFNPGTYVFGDYGIVGNRRLHMVLRTLYNSILDSYSVYYYFGFWGSLTGQDISGSIVIPNTWQHVAFTFDGTTQKIYVNGILDITNKPSSAYDDGGEDIFYGNWFSNKDNITDRLFKGSLLNTIIFDTDLDANAINYYKELYKPNITNNYDNNITWSNFSESIFTRTLDDLNYVNLFIDNNITTTDLGLELDRGIRNAKFTVMTWLKFNPGTYVFGDYGIVGNRRLHMVLRTLYNSILDSYSVYYYFGFWGSLTGQDISGSIVIPNTWQHVAFTFDGTTQKIYVNGILDITNKPSSAYDDGGEDIFYGNWFSNKDNITDRLFKGSLLNTIIFDTDLDANAINYYKELYKPNITNKNDNIHCCPPKIIINNNLSSNQLGQSGSCLFRKLNSVSRSRNSYRIHTSKSNLTNICDEGVDIYNVDKSSPEYKEYLEQVNRINNSNNCFNRNRFRLYF